MSSVRGARWACICQVIIIVFGVNGANAALNHQIVALSGAGAPGAGGAAWTLFNNPSIDATGRIAFQGSVDNANGDDGLWAGPPAGLALGAMRAQAAPGTAPGTAYFGLPSAVPIRAGRIAFAAPLTGAPVTPGLNDQGIWAGAPNGLAKVAQTDDAAAGTTAKWMTINSPALDIAGRVAFDGSLKGPGVNAGVNDVGIWHGPAGGLSLLARTDDVAAGTGGAKWKELSFGALNDGGQAAFGGKITGAGVTPDVNDQGVWRGAPGALTLFARTDSAIPGGGALKWHGLGVPTINNANQLALTATIKGPGVIDGTNDRVVAVGPIGMAMDTVFAARSDDNAPGIGGGVKFKDFSFVSLNATGKVALTGLLKGPGVDGSNDVGLWFGAPGAIDLVARLDGPVAPIGGGVKYKSISLEVLNARGQIAYLAELDGPGITNANDKAILGSDRHGNLMVVARTGDAITVAQGDTRTLASLNMRFGGGGQDGFGAALNDDSYLTWVGRFTDGSYAVFVTQVPEPATVVCMLAVGFAGALRRVRRTPDAARTCARQ